MKARELRIGNYVHHKRLEGLVHFKSFIGLCNFEAKPHDFEAIPLNKEWLLKFGFIKNMKNQYNLQNVNCSYDVYIMKDKSFVVCSDFSDPRKSDAIYIKYVHQLQNLYFALTGEELVIKS